MLHRDSIGFGDTLWDISSRDHEQITWTPAQDFTEEIMRDPICKHRCVPIFSAPFGSPKNKDIYIYMDYSILGSSGVLLFRKIPYCNGLLVLSSYSISLLSRFLTSQKINSASFPAEISRSLFWVENESPRLNYRSTCRTARLTASQDCSRKVQNIRPTGQRTQARGGHQQSDTPQFCFRRQAANLFAWSV